MIGIVVVAVATVVIKYCTSAFLYLTFALLRRSHPSNPILIKVQARPPKASLNKKVVQQGRYLSTFQSTESFPFPLFMLSCLQQEDGGCLPETLRPRTREVKVRIFGRWSCASMLKTLSVKKVDSALSSSRHSQCPGAGETRTTGTNLF